MSYSLAGFKRFCSELRVESGATFVLEPFQERMLRDHFAGVTELVIVIPKKNGKTTLLGALALYHLLEWPEAEVVIGASSRDQARILFKQAAGMVRRSSKQWTFDVKTGYGEIRLAKDERDGPRIRVLAADANTGDGVIPTLALVDELHRHPSADLYGVFRDGLGPRDGQMLTISTAGAALDSPLGLLRRRAHELPTFRRDPRARYNYSRSEDGTFVLHEWCLDPTEDVDDMNIVALANPASWWTPEALRRRHDSPSTTKWQWRRFACGIWTEGEEPWIDPMLWDSLGDKELVLGRDDPIWLGVDVGVRHDSTAIVAVADRGDGVLATKARVISPAAEGGTVSLARVEEAIREACVGRDVRGIAFDPWTFRRSAEILADEGYPMAEFPQSPERMANASENLYRLIESRQLVHDGDPVLRAHVVAGVTKKTERGWRLAKDPKLSRPIDAVIALAMCAQIATVTPITASEPLVAFA